MEEQPFKGDIPGSGRTGFQYQQIAHNLLESGQWSRLIEVGENWLGHDPESEIAHFYLALARTNAGNKKQAFTHVEACLRLSDGDTLGHEVAEFYYRHFKRYEKAIKHLDILIASDHEAHHFHSRAICHHQLNDIEAARKDIQKAMEMDPEDVDIFNQWLLLNQSVTNDQDLKTLISQFNQSLTFDPNNDSVHYLKGLLAHQRHDYQSAIPALREAVRLNPLNKTYQNALLEAIRDSSLFYTFLSIPRKLFDLAKESVTGISRDKTEIITLSIFALPLLALILPFALIVLLPIAVMYYPPMLLLERLTRSDFQKLITNPDAASATMSYGRRQPLILTLVAMVIYWTLLHITFEWCHPEGNKVIVMGLIFSTGLWFMIHSGILMNMVRSDKSS